VRPQRLSSPSLISIDGKNLATRAAAWAQRHAIHDDHALTIAVNRILHILTGLLDTFHPTAMFIAWDHGRSRHRQALYPLYKANRDNKTPAQKALAALVDRLIEALHALGNALPLYQAQVSDCEADDLIAVATRTLAIHHLLYSTDNDYLQLITKRISLYAPHIHEQITSDTMPQHYGLSSSQWLDYKVLVGDHGDNIPGIPGIGDKTAKRLLQHFGTLDKLLADPTSALPIAAQARILLDPTVHDLIARNHALMNLHRLPEEPQLVRSLPFGSPHRPPTLNATQCHAILEYYRCTALIKTYSTWSPAFRTLEQQTATLPDAPLI
jgi:5'-3' exonuclease